MDPNDVLRCEASNHCAQGMVIVDRSIPIREDEQPVESGRSSTEVPDGVKRRLVCPLGVLEDQHRRPQLPGKQIEERLRDSSTVTFRQGIGQRRLTTGDVPEGAEWLGSQQIIAEADQHVRLIPVLFCKRLDESTLADPSLTPKEHHLATGRPDPVQEIGQRIEFAIPLQERRGRAVWSACHPKRSYGGTVRGLGDIWGIPRSCVRQTASPVCKKGGHGRRSIGAMSKRTRIGVVAGAGIGAAAAAALRRRKTHVSNEADAISTSVGRAYLDHLAQAIRIPTVTYEDWDRVDESQLARFREFLLDAYPLTHERLEWETVGDHSLLFRWDGADATLPPVLLMGHYDVVPVEPGTEDTWEQPPFDGIEDDEFLWGRGALDDKGQVIALFEAVESLLSEGFTPTATIYLSIGHDEEVGGSRGASVVAQLLAERGIRFEFALDEGGAVGEELLPGTTSRIGLIGVGEKGYVNVEITAEGDGGHSSSPPRQSAIGRIATTIAALEASPMGAHMEVQQELLAAFAEVLPQPQRFLLRNSGRFSGLLERRFSSAPMTNALIRTTGAPTIVSGGVKPNVLAQRARAIVNFRILQGDTIDDVLAHVRSLAPDGVTVNRVAESFVSEPSRLSSTTSNGFRLVADSIAAAFPGTVPAPWTLMAATDSRHFADIVDDIYRFAPFLARPEDMGRIHGTNERLRVSDADGAVTFYLELISGIGRKAGE